MKSIIFSWRCPLFSSRQEGKGNRFSHRRRKNIEDTAKVVSDVRGTEFIQYLVALGRIAWIRPFLQIILLQFILFFKSPLCYICSVAWNGMNFFRPPNSSDDLCLLFCLFLLLWCNSLIQLVFLKYPAGWLEVKRAAGGRAHLKIFLKNVNWFENLSILDILMQHRHEREGRGMGLGYILP